MTSPIRRRLVQIVAVVLVLAGWQVARPPAAAPATADALAKGFSFQRLPLNGEATERSIRVVAPAYKKIDHWISSLGGAVALADVDANGLPDDVCLVDPRDDSVRLLPAPGTGARYAARQLTAGALPYTTAMAPMGCVPGDYNDDGRTDLLVYFWGRSPILHLNSGAGFTPTEMVTPYEIWNTNAVSLADFDGDGRTDVAIGNYFPDNARILDPTAVQFQIQMQDSMSGAYNAGRNRILLAQGQGRFAEAAGAFDAEMGDGWTLAMGAQDLDHDGRPDLYVANDFGPDRLLRNISTPGAPRFELMEGIRHFTTPKSKALGWDSFKGMGVAFGDLNADEVPDMVVSNITQNYGLHESNFAWLSADGVAFKAEGTASYDDHSEQVGISRSGWGWDVKMGDFAGTGDLQIVQATGFIRGETNRWPELQELAMTNDALLVNPDMWPRFQITDDLSGSDPDRFFVRDENGRFHDLGGRLGLDDGGPTRGIALADVDHDGRLDYAIGNQWRQSHFYRNTRTTDLPHLGLTLTRPATCQGTATPTPAIGAAVRLRSGAAGVTTGQVYPAAGHAGVSSPELLFALSGPAADATLTWRDACGVRHSADTRLTSGWHTVLLGNDGTVKETR
ncbi:VCBS repeat-containing protein [Herbidospora sp. NBRC 101105]|uniref:FG-GAP repeat domain-containing protein n=1 Tax=Herbidospora sp. NBRC 101105 TaxID=3032195 RepID=UPI0024A17A61|nr:VCBS repeat-containing protein [Herbidospora sp. NBRC 101105]GLX99554.1 RNA-binding protein [Herbidospora sp. NBRC 101105]